MKLKAYLTVIVLFSATLIWSQKAEIEELKTQHGIIKINPILHGSLVLT
jgi:hypothetical protein